MEKLKNLTVIGTSHIATQSIAEIEKTVLKTKPKIIALELDQKRFIALIKKQKTAFSIATIKKIGLKAYLFNTIAAYAQKKLGQIVKTKPGSDMRKAIQLAHKTNAKIALIDQDIEITLKKLSKEITLREKFRFLTDIFKSLFTKHDLDKIDLTKVPPQTIIKKLTIKLKKNYPSIYKILIRDRDEIMAKNLYTLMTKNKKDRIVAVVGAGHEKSIISLIKNKE